MFHARYRKLRLDLACPTRPTTISMFVCFASESLVFVVRTKLEKSDKRTGNQGYHALGQGDYIFSCNCFQINIMLGKAGRGKLQ